MANESPDMIGGAHLRLDAVLPAAPTIPIFNYEYTIGVSLDASYMREGALLLSDKDFPLFTGEFKPGFAGALITKIKLSSLLDFSLVPAWVYQSGTMSSHKAVQIPMSLIIKLVRHGESLANVGTLNPAEVGDHTIGLTPLGAEQARQVGRKLGLAFLDGALAYCSPFRRARAPRLISVHAHARYVPSRV